MKNICITCGAKMSTEYETECHSCYQKRLIDGMLHSLVEENAALKQREAALVAELKTAKEYEKECEEGIEALRQNNDSLEKRVKELEECVEGWESTQ